MKVFWNVYSLGGIFCFLFYFSLVFCLVKGKLSVLLMLKLADVAVIALSDLRKEFEFELSKRKSEKSKV